MTENQGAAPELHASIVALVALAANIAANHPKQGLCQLEKLRALGVPDSQVWSVIEIARHIRDEAGEKLDADFDEKAAGILAEAVQPTSGEKPKVAKGKPLNIAINSGACCTPTASGQSCC